MVPRVRLGRLDHSAVWFCHLLIPCSWLLSPTPSVVLGPALEHTQLGIYSALLRGCSPKTSHLFSLLRAVLSPVHFAISANNLGMPSSVCVHACACALLSSRVVSAPLCHGSSGIPRQNVRANVGLYLHPTPALGGVLVQLFKERKQIQHRLLHYGWDWKSDSF